MLRLAFAFVLLSASTAWAEELACQPKGEEVSAQGDFQNQQYVFVITLDGKRLPDDDTSKTKTVPCPLTS